MLPCRKLLAEASTPRNLPRQFGTPQKCEKRFLRQWYRWKGPGKPASNVFFAQWQAEWNVFQVRRAWLKRHGLRVGKVTSVAHVRSTREDYAERVSATCLLPEETSPNA